jgi:hypothetical protein
VTTDVVAGAAYLFRLQARNIHGWGVHSVEMTIAAASTPDAPTTVVTTIENIYVRLAWNEPAANSAAIDGYDVYIMDSTGSYVRESTYCDGFTNSVVLEGAYCLVPMSILQGETYGLTLGTLIRAKIRAHNIYGYGDFSGVNSYGEYIQTEPGQVAGLGIGAGTTESVIELVWSELTTSAETGGAGILSYSLEWDQGTGYD